MEGASFVTIPFISCMRCLNIEGQTHHLMIKPQIMPPTDNLCLKSSPVHKARKFSAVFGTTSPKRPITILPTSSPPTSTSKKHLVVTFACRSTSWYNRVMRTQDPNTYVVPKMEGATYAYFKNNNNNNNNNSNENLDGITYLSVWITQSSESLLRQQIHRINRAPPQAENWTESEAKAI